MREINVGDTIYLTQKGVDEEALTGLYQHLYELEVESRELEGEFSSYYLFDSSNNAWEVCNGDFEDGVLTTYDMLSSLDKIELSRRKEACGEWSMDK